MISFSAGLVLRLGERTLEFERDLGSGQIQFKYLDNYQIVTYKWGVLYAKILNKEIVVVHQNGHKVHLPPMGASFPEGSNFELTLSDSVVEEIEFRMRYVQRCRSIGVSLGSITQIQNCLENMEADKLGRPVPSAWTVRCWLKKYTASGNSPHALLDRRSHAPHFKRVAKPIDELISAAIERHYLQLCGVSAKETWRRLCNEMSAQNRTSQVQVEVPSLSTINRRVSDIDPFIRDYKRCGPGYARNKWRYSLAGDCSTRILERVEIDHTWLDIWVLDPKSGVPIGRPWITILIDRFSGYVLGLHISFYGPSVGSVAAAMRNAILPKDDLLTVLAKPDVSWTAMGAAEMYVVDNGLEFHSKAFLRLAWHLRADLLFNPVRQPWLKASIERCMMEVCRILPARGKVHAPRKNMVPQDPKAGAAILFDDLCLGLVLWAADRFPKQIHIKRLVRPIDLWEEGRQASPLPRFPVTMDSFDIVAGISTERTIDGDGVFFHYLRYNSPELQDYRRSHRSKFRTEVRFNPDDLGSVHVHLPEAKAWLAVPLQRPSLEYGAGLSLIQHQIIRSQAGKKLTALNAEEQLAKASLELQEFWNEAIGRGVQLRRDSELIRLQGLTSTKIFAKSKICTAVPAPLPETSPLSERILANAMPFPAFLLQEEYV